LNDDRTEKEEKKTIEGNTFERGHNTEQQYKIEQAKEATKGLQMIINIRQTEMLFNKSRVLIMSSRYMIMILVLLLIMTRSIS
jgi:hypothetical protein